MKRFYLAHIIVAIVCRGAWHPTRMQVLPVIKIFLNRAIRIIPWAEVMEPTLDLLRPPFRRVWEQWKIGTRFLRLVRVVVRDTLWHDDDLLCMSEVWWAVAAMPHGYPVSSQMSVTL